VPDESRDDAAAAPKATKNAWKCGEDEISAQLGSIINFLSHFFSALSTCTAAVCFFVKMLQSSAHFL
jgi:hypothetical protein